MDSARASTVFGGPGGRIAYRAVNKGAETFYKKVLAEGHQRDVVPLMQSRDELYAHLDYHSYEEKLDELFSQGK